MHPSAGDSGLKAAVARRNVQWRNAAWALAAFAAYYSAGVLGLSLSFVHASVSPVWPPTGVAIAALALLGLRYWPIVLAGAFLFNLQLTPVAPSAIIALGNTLEAVVGATVLQRLGGSKAFASAPKTMLFGAGGMIASAISASVGTAALVWLLGAPGAGSIWITWWLGDLGGALVLAPAIVLLVRPVQGLRWTGVAVAVASTLLAAAMFWSTAAPAAAVALLFVLPAWAVLQEGPAATSLSIVGLSGAAVVGTIAGRGPFFAGTENDALLLLQLFTAALSLTCLALAAGRHASKSSDDGTRRTQSWLRMLPALLALIPLVVGVAVASGPLQDAGQETLEDRRALHATRVADAYRDAIDLRVTQLTGMAGFFEVGNVSRDMFHEYLDAVGLFDDGVPPQAASFNRLVRSDDVPAFEADRRQVFGPDFAVRPDTGAPVRYVVDYIHPLQGNEPALGLDIGFNASRLAVIEQALAGDSVVATGPLQLVQGTFGTLMMKAVPDGNGGHQGLVVFVTGIDDLRQSIIEGLARDGVNGTATVFPAGLEGPRVGPMIEGPSSQRILDTPGGPWVLHIPDPAGLLTITESGAPWITVASAGALSLTLAGMVYAYDATRRKAQEIADELVMKAAEADAARNRARQLKELDRMKSDFINMAAHELRTPLVPLRAQVAVLRMKFGEAAGDSLGVMERSLERLGGLVEDLLTAARAQSGRISVDARAANPHGVVRAIQEDYRAAAQEGGVSLEVNLVGDGKVVIDPPRISQVVSNLVSNALKFTPSGGRIVVTSKLGDGWTLTVQDDGAGMEPSSIGHLFQPFAQVHDPSGPRGSGLGLYVCRSIVEAHGGTIRAWSAGHGQGATFEIKIPPQHPDTPPSPP